MGFATSVLALGRWPEWLSDIIVGMHEHAYYKWSDTRDFTPRCFVCTQPIADESATSSPIFCSSECRAVFEEHVRRSRRVMPSPVGEVHDVEADEKRLDELNEELQAKLREMGAS